MLFPADFPNKVLAKLSNGILEKDCDEFVIPTNEELMHDCLELCRLVLPLGFGNPDLSPRPDGTLYAEWQMRNYTVSVNFYAPSHYMLCYRGEGWNLESYLDSREEVVTRMKEIIEEWQG